MCAHCLQMGWYAIKTHSDQSDTLEWRLASPIQYGAGTTWWLEFNGGHVNWQGKVCLTVSFTSIATNIENSGLSLQVLVPARWLPTKVPSRMEWLAAVFDKYTYYPPSWCTAPLTTNGLEVVNRHCCTVRSTWQLLHRRVSVVWTAQSSLCLYSLLRDVIAAAANPAGWIRLPVRGIAS